MFKIFLLILAISFQVKAENLLQTCKGNIDSDKIAMSWLDKDGHKIKYFESLLKNLNSKKIKCAMNGGIYNQEFHPLGLYAESGKILSKLNTRKNAYGNFYLQPNGIFFITKNSVGIMSTEKYLISKPNLMYATQSGPILFLNKKINTLFTKTSNNRLLRNAVCTLSNKEVLFAITKRDMNFYELSDELLRKR